MRISQEQLEKMIKEAIAKKLSPLKEEARGEDSEVGTGVPDAKKVVALLKKFDDLIEDTIKKARELADEGEDLIQTNLLSHPEVGTRNELLKNRVGMLRSMANNLATTFERVKRFSP